MNEISNFCNIDGTGQVCKTTVLNVCTCATVDSSNSLDFPPYAIHNIYGKLSTKTVAMSATYSGNISMYNAHNLYGLTEQVATNNALTEIRGKRPFILSRSSFLSTGVHSAKWTGDNGKYLFYFNTLYLNYNCLFCKKQLLHGMT